ncbi:PD-(D/E)XK nuclease family protein [Hymenobacter sp. HSC-4F20]|uniref:PD-(D/E)XK nuclease family protein n=1 Tax=Hymenobacter sp. HSC-4F20 TaxID=2864135 RepID=UPI001C72DA6D|nr:PD-(D/E)XK nuclease family protein [Hymenobacter sp. HSC-4F20]MBX0293161.1 PD-(D/E)XK nuclease family protein [Hymenobacter sp. HSC-4F20]
MNYSETTSLTTFLRTARWPVFTKQQPTFFSIAGISGKELPLSNTYSFFFQSEADHGLGVLFTLALLDVVRRKSSGTKLPVLDGPVRVSREHSMDEGQWLDLLVHNGTSDSSLQGATFAILIENKVNHWLHNDLDNYWNSVRGPACKVGIVLGKNPEHPDAPWLFVSHPELAQAVEARLGAVLSQANTRYLPLLLHLLEYLKQMTDSNHDNFALAFNFAHRHRAALAQAQKVINQFNDRGLADVIVEAWGPDYKQQGVFEDRVDVMHVQRNDMRYIVFYGHMLELDKEPTYAITLYAGRAERKAVANWFTYLSGQQAAIDAGLSRLDWFDQSYKELVIGKKYTFIGSSVEEFRQEVREALERDWKPLESAWLTKSISANSLEATELPAISSSDALS